MVLVLRLIKHIYFFDSLSVIICENNDITQIYQSCTEEYDNFGIQRKRFPWQLGGGGGGNSKKGCDQVQHVSGPDLLSVA